MLGIIKKILIGIIGLVGVLAILYLLLPKGPNELLSFDDPWGKSRPMKTVSEHGVVAGTPWASEVALATLNRGGNAFDAAIAGLYMLYVTHGESSAFPGIAPMMIYHADSDTIRSYVGAGSAPAGATIQQFKERGFETVPTNDIYAQLIPGGPDAAIAILKEYGSMTFSELVQPAIDRALEGFPVHHVMHENLNLNLIKRLGYRLLMPYNAQVYLGNRPWKPLYLKERFQRPDLAKTLNFLVSIEQEAIEDGKTRIEALDAVRAAFYKGDIAAAITTYHQRQEGLITLADLANYTGRWEQPSVGQLYNYQIYSNGPWSQGMTLAMAMNILSQVDLRSMGHNSAEYIHTVTQAIELAMSDREAYFGDPEFVDVPIAQLLDDSYGKQRIKLLSKGKAFDQLPKPIKINGYEPFLSNQTPTAGSESQIVGDDTSQIIVADSAGNVIAITPSDFPMTPMIPDWDITLGNRMNQFRLDSNHPAALQPGKRPRVTPQAIMIQKENEFYMAINTPGGDNQIQAMLQVLINHLVFEDDIQTSIERPRFKTLGFPNSFAPHGTESATLEVEENIGRKTINNLKQYGYEVRIVDQWNIAAGVGAIIKSDNSLHLGSDPRAETIALGK